VDKKDMTRLGVGIAVVLAVAILASFAVRIFASDTPPLVLPPETVPSSSPGPEDGDPFAGNVLRVDVTVDSVQSVIATLARPVSYSREVTLETFWADAGEEDGRACAVTQSQVWAEGAYTRIDMTLSTGRTCHRLVAGDTLYLWYDNESEYASLPADGRSADVEQHIPTYEDVLGLSPEEITDAGYEQVGEVSCIFVEVDSNAMGYRERFWVSVDNGLLVAAETWNGDSLIYRMSGLHVTIPGEGGAFLLPDGTDVRARGSY